MVHCAQSTWPPWNNTSGTSQTSLRSLDRKPQIALCDPEALRKPEKERAPILNLHRSHSCKIWFYQHASQGVRVECNSAAWQSSLAPPGKFSTSSWGRCAFWRHGKAGRNGDISWSVDKRIKKFQCFDSIYKYTFHILDAVITPLEQEHLQRARAAGIHEIEPRLNLVTRCTCRSTHWRWDRCLCCRYRSAPQASPDLHCEQGGEGEDNNGAAAVGAVAGPADAAGTAAGDASWLSLCFRKFSKESKQSAGSLTSASSGISGWHWSIQ